MDRVPQNTKDILVAIFEEVTAQGKDISSMKSVLVDVQEQVKYTNGRVTGLEKDKIRREAKEEALSTMPQTVVRAQTANVTTRIDREAVNKLIVAVTAAIGLATVWLSSLVTGGKP